MATKHKLPPSAASLSASMRDLGYSLEAAVADLIDNSISAGATNIDIFVVTNIKDPTVVICDDGSGMLEPELFSAMRHGSGNPNAERSEKDLGRFGLGLKTASFSQCRSLTVLSAVDGKRSAAQWDLDLIDKEDDWVLSLLTDQEITALPYQEKVLSHGTAVIWHNLDRLFEDQVGNLRDELINEKLTILNRHLSLVFHRFLSGDVKGFQRISITLNGHVIEPFDPFCVGNPATQVLPEEFIRYKDSVVKLQPYILPHHSRLSAEEHRIYKDRNDFVSAQGAYVYRNGRLIAWGDWFRLVPKSESTKLARVKIDFTNTLDSEWTIDIKKSRASPPRAIRERMRQIIDNISSRSIRVHRGRGERLFSQHTTPVWERHAEREGIRYSINREHPIIKRVLSTLATDSSDQLLLYLDALSASLPVEMIYSDFATEPRKFLRDKLEEEEVIHTLKRLADVLFESRPVDINELTKVARSTYLFSDEILSSEDILEKVLL